MGQLQAYIAGEAAVTLRTTVRTFPKTKLEDKQHVET